MRESILALCKDREELRVLYSERYADLMAGKAPD